MSQLGTFFHGSDTQFGIFYPSNYLLAIFPALNEATAAQHAIRNSPLTGSDSLAVPGEEVLQYARENLQKKGLWTLLMSSLSRLIGTEAVYADQDLELASQGSAFLAVYAPTEGLKNAAWELIAPFHPSVARYYTAGGIEVLGKTELVKSN